MLVVLFSVFLSESEFITPQYSCHPQMMEMKKTMLFLIHLYNCDFLDIPIMPIPGLWNL